MANAPTDEQDVDTHDPAGMAAFMRCRAQHSREFVKLTSEEQIRHFMQQWQKNILPHFAFRFEQAATMVERMAAGLYRHACTCGCSDLSPAAHSAWCTYRIHTLGESAPDVTPNLSTTGE